MFIKQGQICTHFAQCPVVDKLEDRWRIYYSYRDKENQSHTTYMDVEPGNPKNIIYKHGKEILPLGQKGAFDEHGIMPTCIIDVGASKYLYYIGWSRKADVPYENSTGLAISTAGGDFVKYPVPVLTKGEGDLFTGTCWVSKFLGAYVAFYLSGYKWENGDPCYHIKTAFSPDGIIWNKNVTEFLDTSLLNVSSCSFSGIGKIQIRSDRDNGKRNYRIEGTHRILPSESGWDSEMTCYPYLVEHAGKVYCFYNGNGHGKTGIGYATLVGNAEIEYQWSRRGFITRYYEITRTAETYQYAYEQTEKEHLELFGHRRYSDYKSFYHSFRSFLKKS